MAKKQAPETRQQCLKPPFTRGFAGQVSCSNNSSKGFIIDEEKHV
jgi:hypothetical protein